ncbi:MAG TPA: EamA family transporter [Methylomirabilota bacterium]|nr:EamA family transporter [Methylomirabilota bacterium]
MPTAYVVLILANIVYGSSYAVSRVVLEHMGPATLSFFRLAIGSLVLVPLALAQRRDDVRLSRADKWNIFWMGLCGFAGAFAFGNWGLRFSTATNAALLITVEPVSLILLSPLVLGEHLTRREGVGALLTVVGATVVVLNGIPGASVAIAPHWRGDLLLVLSGLAYAGYSLFGRDVLARHKAVPVTAWSILWGLVVMVPFTVAEWVAGDRPLWTGTTILGTLYLGLVITALGYLLWNWGLERVEAPRLAIFVNIQPLAGALLGVVALHEALTAYTVAGGILILAGVHTAVRAKRAQRGSIG